MRDRGLAGAWSAIAALALAIAFIVPAGAVGQGGGTTPPAPTNFPYSYGQPTVPRYVGAQGTQGLIPGTSIGPVGATGVSGHVGPVNSTQFAGYRAASGTLEVQAFNGTTTTTVAQRQLTSLVNITQGTKYQGSTNTHGFVNITAPSGWYVLEVNASSSSYVSYGQMYDLPASGGSLRVFLIQGSNTVGVVNNGGTQGTLWFTNPANWGNMPQVQINLHESSATGPIVGTAYTASNGTVEFTEVNTAYSYFTEADGYENNLTGARYFMGNATEAGGGITVTAGQNHVTGNTVMAGRSGTTGTLVGTSLPVYDQTNTNNGSYWYITSPTTITGGVTYISLAVHPAGTTDHLTFVNTVVYWNTTFVSQSLSGLIVFKNSTFVYLVDDQQALYFQPGYEPYTYFNNSLMIGLSPYSPTFYGGQWWGFSLALDSEFYDPASYSIFGDFVNDLFLNGTGVEFGRITGDSFTGYTNLTRVTVENTTVGNPSTLPADQTTGQFLGLYSSSIVNSTILYTAKSQSMVNSTAQFVPAWGYKYNYGTEQSSGEFTNWTHDTVTLTVGTSNYTGLFNSLGSQLKSLRSTIDFGLGSIFNMSYSTLDFGVPMFNTTAYAGETMDLFDSVLDGNYTVSQLTTIPSEEYPLYGQAVPLSYGNATISYCDLETGGWATFDFASAGNGSRITFSHDLFPWVTWSNPDYWQMFFAEGSYDATHGITVTFENTTWLYIYFNATQLNPLLTYFGFSSDSFLFTDADVAVRQHGDHVAFVYDTFWPHSVGGGSFAIAGLLAFAAGGVFNTVADCVFWNEQSHDLGGFGTAYAYGPDITDTSGVVSDTSDTNISGDWFLNLNNHTTAFAEGTFNANTSVPCCGWSPKATLTSDHFYFSPQAPSESILPSAFYDRKMTGPGSTYAGPSGSTIQTNSTMGYEASASYPNGSISFSGVGQLVSNSSIRQAGISSQGVLSAWVWTIAPDVNVTSGRPVVSQTNGLVSGPQPNFFWHGYNYSEQVEPSYIQIGVNSTKAPPVTLSFANLQSGYRYEVNEYDSNNGTLLGVSSVTASPQGTVNTTFYPAIGQLNVTFQVVAAQSFSIGGPDGSWFTTQTLFLMVFALVALTIAATWISSRREP